MRKLSLICTLFLLAAPFLSAQEPQEEPRFEEELDVNVVLVDAIVTDRRGNQILGLGPDDFIITEDGVRQEIESVDYYTNRRLVTSPEEKAKFDVQRVREMRYFILFFDKPPGATQVEGFNQELWRAINGAKEFVKADLFPEDYVAVLGHDARLEIYTDFTNDRAKILGALDEARRFSSGTLDAPPANGPSILAHLDPDRVMRRTGQMYDALAVLGTALQQIQGRKVMMLFTPGIPGRSGSGLPLEDRYYKPMVEALNAANTSVYGLNLLPMAQYHSAEQNVHRLTGDTGGTYYRTAVNFVTPLRMIENRNNGYYLLTYRTSRPKDAHGYQEIDVRLRNPEFRIEARQGYLY
jgi:VWFA-related protein